MKRFVSEYKIERIWEEFNIDACIVWGIEETIVKTIAENSIIEHEYCEMSEENRLKLWIKPDNEKDFPVREQFRLDKIKLQNYNNILFVCWRKHKCTFKPLLEENWYEVKILWEYPEEQICISDKNPLLW